MSDAARGPAASGSGPSSGGGEPFAVPLFAIVLVTALAAGAAGHLLAGASGWAAAGVVALFGGVVAGVASRGGSGNGESHARLLTSALRAEHAMSPSPPAGWNGAWTALYERVSELSQESKMSHEARVELERLRRQTELALNVLREGKDPLVEIAELRVGPLRELLETAQARSGAAPVVNRIPLSEEELVGVDGEPLPEPWPKEGAAAVSSPAAVSGAALSPAAGPAVLAEARRGIEELITGLSRLIDAANGPGGDAAAAGAARTPAQLVDAVVHTAADGIEDLAAGLMRANELAAVAERVTNKATLLALNAALEATRSGSEAFAAIAEETRRLAEFAREATDTISRLSSEIEYKVGETITAIHATSEDAKSAVAALPSAMTGDAPARPAIAPAAIERLLRTARAIRDRLDATAVASPAPAPRDVTPPLDAPVPAGSMPVDSGSRTGAPQAIVEEVDVSPEFLPDTAESAPVTDAPES
ncbi:MAG: methyl-accepting chemotaxis protein, partial [Hyphomicrobiales bacterium]